MFENTTLVSGKKATTEFIAGHPNWCHRVNEWGVDIHFIGASAVQGRKIWGVRISKPQTVYIKRTETASA